MSVYNKHVLKNLSLMNKVLRDYKPVLELYDDISKIYPPHILDIMLRYQALSETASRYELSTHYVSQETSKNILTSSTALISELESCELLDDAIEPIHLLKHLLISSKKISLSDIIAIISLLLSLLIFLQSNMPNSQINKIETSLEQLIELQERELHLLEQQQINNPSLSTEQEAEQSYPKPD